MFQPKWETEYFIICKGGQCSVFRLVQWKEVFQKRHAHNQNPKSTIVIVVVIQHKQIVPNPHKHHCHQSTPRWVNCVKTGWRWYWRHRELVFPKAYLFLGMCIWYFGKYFVCLDTVAWGTLAECWWHEAKSHNQCSQQKSPSVWTKL